MLLDTKTMDSLIFGAIRAEENDGYRLYHRFTEDQVRRIESCRQPNAWQFVAFSSAGMRLDVTGEIRSLSFSYRLRSYTLQCPGAFDVYENGALRLHQRSMTVPGVEEAAFTYVPTKPGRITVYFPNYAALSLKDLEIEGSFAPAEEGAKLLTLGDSITQGAFPPMPGQSYVNIVGRNLNANVLNQACSGFRHKLYPWDTIDFKPDVITVAYGTNDWTLGDDTDADSRAFYGQLKARFPGVPVFVMTPVYRDRAPVPPFAENDRTRNALGRTLEDQRRILTENASACGFTPVDGLKLMPHELAYLQADRLHPLAGGHEAIGAAMTEILKNALPALFA